MKTWFSRKMVAAYDTKVGFQSDDDSIKMSNRTPLVSWPARFSATMPVDHKLSGNAGGKTQVSANGKPG